MEVEGHVHVPLTSLNHIKCPLVCEYEWLLVFVFQCGPTVNCRPVKAGVPCICQVGQAPDPSSLPHNASPTPTMSAGESEKVGTKDGYMDGCLIRSNVCFLWGHVRNGKISYSF